MSEHLRSINYLLDELTQIGVEISTLHPEEEVPKHYLTRLQSLFYQIRNGMYKLRDYGLPLDMKTDNILISMINRLQDPMTARDALGLISGYKSTIEYSSSLYPTETEYERRFRVVERELAQLRAKTVNPELEKKVLELEGEVRQLRSASIHSNNVEKKQEDMLKSYMSAKKKVFVIMPFAPKFDDVWTGGIERACNQEKFGYLRVDKISLSTWITEDIEKYIEMADVVIADITENNPNVMFEFGWALAKEKKPIVIRDQNDSNQVPFDVKDIRYISYNNSWSGIESLHKNICKFLQSTSEEVNEKKAKK